LLFGLVFVAVWTRLREGQAEDAISRYYQPKAKGLIVLYNGNGEGHYEWVSFAHIVADVINVNLIDTTTAPTEELPPHPILVARTTRHCSKFPQEFLNQFSSQMALLQ